MNFSILRSKFGRFLFSGTFYHPEKPPMFDENHPSNQPQLPRRQTSVPPQSRPILPVPIVYH